MEDEDEDDFESDWALLSRKYNTPEYLEPGAFLKDVPLVDGDFENPLYLALHNEDGELPLSRQLLPPLKQGVTTESVTFPQMTTAAVVTHFAIYRGLRSANPLFLAEVSMSRPINVGDQMFFDAGSITISDGTDEDITNYLV